MIPLCIPNLSGNEGKYLADCVTSTFVSSVGPYVDKFEKMVSKATNAPLVVATSAGTTGLHAAYVAAGVEYGDLVICPALTFIATANAISHAGATPWLMDVSKNSWTLDVSQLKNALHLEAKRNSKGELIHQKTGRKVVAITPVFTMGMPADMDDIVDIAKNYKLALIVDGAAALGGSYKGRLTGELGADLTMYSFNGNKMVTAGGGGAVVGHNENLLNRLRHLTTTARKGSDYDHDMVGFNYRMTNIQAAVGCAQMEQLDDFVAAKKNIDQLYREAFLDLPDISGFPILDDRQSANWFSGFHFHSDNGAELSRKLRATLKSAGIDARPFWKPMHLQKPYCNAPSQELLVSDNIWEQIITLPCSTQLSKKDQYFVIDAVHNWFKVNGFV